MLKQYENGYGIVHEHHLSITYQENSSSGRLANDKTAVLSVDDYSQDDNNSGTGKEKQKERKLFAEDDDPSFKHQINEITKWPPGSLNGDNGMEKDKQVENNDSINANHQEHV